jgi:ABC-type multidrug transport system fused ATPase/permease subunit
VIEQGRLAESGTHQELIERGGIYRRLHDLQFAG